MKKLNRKVTGQSTAVDMTDEIYAELSASQQLIAAIAEALDLPVLVAKYQDRHYVSRQTVDAVASKLS